MTPTFSLVNEVNATKKNWALRVLVVRAYETSSRDNPDERSTLEFVFQDMKVLVNVAIEEINDFMNKFRLQLRVVDNTGNAAFLVRNHEAVDLLGKTVAELNAKMPETVKLKLISNALRPKVNLLIHSV
ncbi:Uncharacterized protein Fot_14076 [Forsythia ovata]|uniref:Uncharacterized protein n=1 Tax=Forsythia ovata TaxID=205694 RepID=A0ABD1W5A8_9LAMI